MTGHFAAGWVSRSSGRVSVSAALRNSVKEYRDSPQVLRKSVVVMVVVVESWSGVMGGISEGGSDMLVLKGF